MEWQPIETAPKDETELLLINNSRRIAEGYWAEWAGADGNWVCASDSDCRLPNGEWDYSDDGLEYFYPTHWQPLPEPPA